MELRRGILQAWDAGTYTATVQFDGSRSHWLASIPVSRDIAGAEMIAGRFVVVAFHRPNDPTSAMLLGVST